MIKMNTIDFLEKVLDKSIEYSGKLVFNKEYQQHLYLVSLYCRIIELTHSCTILMKEKIISGVPIILRTVLETFADLKNLSDDEKYVNFMKAGYLKEWLRKKVYAEHETELQKLKKKRYAPLNHYERLEKAGMVNEYRSVYNFLCSHSHSNIRSLYYRYTNITGDNFTVICYKEPKQHNIDLYSTTLRDMLVSASLTIHKFFGSGLISQVESIHAEWEDIKTKHIEKKC